MITEDYVSFKVAKLLKEKGFDERCYGYYYTSKYMTYGDIKQRNLELSPDSYSAPTLQMAMKWLREVHNLHIGVIVAYRHLPRRYEAHIMKLKSIDDFILNQLTDFASYEEACEAAIRYCLENLI